MCPLLLFEYQNDAGQRGEIYIKDSCPDAGQSALHRWFPYEAEQVKPLVRDAFQRGKIVGAICNASVFMGVHGFLNDVKEFCRELLLLLKADTLEKVEASYIFRRTVS